MSNDKLSDGLKKSIKNATKICHSIFLGVKAVLLSIRFRGYSSKTLQRNITLKENMASRPWPLQLGEFCAKMARG